MVYVPDPATRVAMLKAGEADIIYTKDSLIPSVQADRNLRIIWAKATNGRTIGFADMAFPKDPSPFLDRRVRLACNLAVDREMLVKKVLHGSAAPYGGDILPPVTLGYDPTINSNPYDPEKARALLAEAGYPNGFETVMHAPGNWKYWEQAVANYLAEIGIKCKMKVYEWGAYVGAIKGKKMRGLFGSRIYFNSSKHPSFPVENQFNSKSFWCYGLTTPEIEKAIADSNLTRSDEEAAAAGKKISQLIRDAMFNIQLFRNHNAWAISPKIKKYEVHKGIFPATRFEYMKINR